MAENATGIIITGASGFLAEIVSVNGPSASRKILNTSHMGTTGWHTKIAGDLIDGGQLRCRIRFVPSTLVPIDEAAETWTITWPDSAATGWSFTGQMVNFEITSELEELIEADATIEVMSAITGMIS